MASKTKAFGPFERKIALRYLRARKKEGGVALIAAISFTCLMLAIAALIIVMSIMNGFRGELVTRILGAQGHAYVWTVEDNPEAAKVDGLLNWLRVRDDVELAYPKVIKQAFITYNKNGTGAFVHGIYGDDFRSIPYVQDSIEYGTIANFGRGENGGDEIVMGLEMARMIGATVGDRVTIISPQPVSTPMGTSIRRKSYIISAIFSMGFMDADNGYVYMPMEQALLFFDVGEASDQIEIRLHDPDDINVFSQSLRSDAPVPLTVATWRERSRSIAGALKVEQIAMRLILMIVVVIAIFPIIAAMIMLVKNKGRDIAILRTVGATQGSILRIFFMIGTMIGVLGTAAGIALGVLFCLNIGTIQSFLEWALNVQLFPPDVYELTGGIPAKVVPGEVIMVAFWGFLVASVATFFPAWGASKLDPVEAFRNE